MNSTQEPFQFINSDRLRGTAKSLCANDYKRKTMLSSGKMDKPLSILHLISNLGPAGAEMMLAKVLSRLDRARFTARVISLIDYGPTSVSKTITGLGIPIQYLGMREGRPSLVALLKLVRLLRDDPPDVIQTWMYHSDLIGGIAAKLAGGIPVLWGIRQSNLDPEASSRLTLLTMKTCASLSSWLPKRILCCSEVARNVHVELGYAADKMIVVPNGFDLEVFKPDPVARASVRTELGIPEAAPLIGLMARFDAQKDHSTFLKAVKLLVQERSDVHLIMCGSYGVTSDNVELARLIDEAGIRAQVRLLGRRNDMARLTAALDITVLSSAFGEGFPNTIGEAMSCGVPCVVTDVGDSRLIVGETGMVVPKRNSPALAKALRKMVDLGREGRSQLGMAARQRIKEQFDLSQIVARYESLHEELACANVYKRFRTG